VKICYFEPVLRCVHDYTNQFNMKWKKNPFGGRKVVEQATLLAHWAQKLSGRLPALLRRQCSPDLQHLGCAKSAMFLENIMA